MGSWHERKRYGVSGSEHKKGRPAESGLEAKAYLERKLHLQIKSAVAGARTERAACQRYGLAEIGRTEISDRRCKVDPVEQIARRGTERQVVAVRRSCATSEWSTRAARTHATAHRSAARTTRPWAVPISAARRRG